MTEKIDPARQAGASNTTTWNGAIRTPPFIAHPSDVVDDAAHSVEQKRLILASWLSDRHAVPDAPRWRELENGAFVDVHEIEQALRILDDIEASRSGHSGLSSSSGRRKLWKKRFGDSTQGDHDDDDPPPYPGTVGGPVPPRDRDMGAAAERKVAD